MAKRNEQRRVTLKDVAELAEVSVFTASRALSGEGGVSPQALERVQRAADELGYVVNELARALRGSKSRMLGVLTADIGNAFFGTLVQAIDTTAYREGWLVLSGDPVDEHGHYHPDIEEMFLRSLQQARVAGIIVSYPPALEKLDDLTTWHSPLLFVDSTPPKEFQQFPFVVSDGLKGGRLVGEHFAKHGYSRWLLVGHSRSWATRSSREAGFMEIARRCGADVEVVEGGNNIAESSSALERYFDALDGRTFPDAIFATNEPLLQGCYQALKGRGIVVGRDVGVIGYDEFAWARLMEPSVTVVDQDPYQMGCMAATELMRLIEAGGGSPDAVVGGKVFDPRLVVRQSCGCSADAST